MSCVCNLFLFIFISYASLEIEAHPKPLLLEDIEQFRDPLRSVRISSSLDRENDQSYWRTEAQLKLHDQLLRRYNTKIAKNIIIFLGDGMSIPTLTAARTYFGQMQGNSGEEAQLSFEKFPYVGLSKTYCVDKQVADSACSATAYLGGVKANSGTIGVSGRVKRKDCAASLKKANHVDSIVVWAQEAGKGTGLVTTTRVTHASPTGTYGHIADRRWECDADVLNAKQDPSQCQDIASQLINNSPGNQFKVIFGGGRAKFLPMDVEDESGNYGERRDGINLIETWVEEKRDEGQFIFNRQGLINLNVSTTKYVLGLFATNHLSFYLDADHDEEPTLAEMTEAAIKILQKEDKGYLLFVEGGRIDHGHHGTKARKALSETVQFSEAIQLATELTNQEDTLIVVTSDHAHTMSMSGYSNRGVSVLGLNTLVSDKDKLPYTTLSYANGPSVKINRKGERENITTESFDKDYKYPALVPNSHETHGGDDVGVFALGPWSHLFSGVYEQNTILWCTFFMDQCWIR